MPPKWKISWGWKQQDNRPKRWSGARHRTSTWTDDHNGKIWEGRYDTCWIFYSIDAGRRARPGGEARTGGGDDNTPPHHLIYRHIRHEILCKVAKGRNLSRTTHSELVGLSVGLANLGGLIHASLMWTSLLGQTSELTQFLPQRSIKSFEKNTRVRKWLIPE